ncbi:calcium-binding protein KIC-like [Miscanthus floridulus]|uniref:calcium-binding protein KIC-like n=1 Tax=Miscanthus floridulus TaxID=154761 RepID=UPI003458D48A
MRELASGFRQLMDPARGLITFDSLRRSASLLGLGGMSDDDLRGMLAEGDFDGDGALSEMEFCVVMVRLSPELMDEPRRWLDDAVDQASRFLFTSAATTVTGEHQPAHGHDGEQQTRRDDRAAAMYIPATTASTRRHQPGHVTFAR